VRKRLKESKGQQAESLCRQATLKTPSEFLGERISCSMCQ